MQKLVWLIRNEANPEKLCTETCSIAFIFERFPTKVRPSFESFFSVGTFNIVPFVQVSHIWQMADVVVLFFLFEFRGRSAFEYASKCSFSQTITKLGTSSFIWYWIYYWKVTQTKLLSSFIQSFRLYLNAFYTFDPELWTLFLFRHGKSIR